MFWSLVVEPNKCYSQTVAKSFHISSAALDKVTGDVTSLTISPGQSKERLVACHLTQQSPQCALDLNFEEGEFVAFRARGSGVIHLMGYLIEDETPDMDDLEDGLGSDEEMEDGLDAGEDDSEDGEDDAPTLIKAMANNKKRKASPSIEDAVKSLTEQKKKKKKVESSASETNPKTNGVAKKEKKGAAIDQDDLLPSDSEDEDWEEAEDEEGGSDDEEDEDQESDDEEEASSGDEDGGSPAGSFAALLKKKLSDKVAASPKGTPKSAKEATKRDSKVQSTPAVTQGQKTENRGGVIISELKGGNGPVAKSGKFVHVYYTGKLKSSGKVFDSQNQGKGFKFRLGGGEVIKGWDKGIEGMKVGAKRRLEIPPKLAYGERGANPDIPGNATLIFDVQLKAVS